MRVPTGHTPTGRRHRLLPTVSGKRFDTYLLPHVAPDGTVWTTTTLLIRSAVRVSRTNDINLVWSTDGGVYLAGTAAGGSVTSSRRPTRTRRSGRASSTRSRSGRRKRRTASTRCTSSYEDGSKRPVERLPDRLFRRRPLLVCADPGQRQSSAPVRRAAAEFCPWRRMGPYRSRSTTGASHVRQPVSSEAAGLRRSSTTRGRPRRLGHRGGRANYCVNSAIQFNRPNLAPLGRNVRLSAHTWDPQLSAPHQSCICSSGTFIGDYFGV